MVGCGVANGSNVDPNWKNSLTLVDLDILEVSLSNVVSEELKNV
jgi:hypothetical protein